jgi:hypothetical protein
MIGFISGTIGNNRKLDDEHTADEKTALMRTSTIQKIKDESIIRHC